MNASGGTLYAVSELTNLGCYAIKLAKDAHQREEPHRALRR